MLSHLLILTIPPRPTESAVNKLVEVGESLSIIVEEWYLFGFFVYLYLT